MAITRDVRMTLLMRLRVVLANRIYLVRSVATLKYREELTFDGRLIVFVLAYGFFLPMFTVFLLYL